MEQPGSPTPSDTPEEGAPTDLPLQPDEDLGEQGATADGEEDSPGAPNPDEDSATEGSGDSDPAATLNEMYLTLAHLVAAHDLHRADAEQQLKKLSATAQELQQKREEALASGDHMAYANAVRGLNEVGKIADILQNDAEDDLRGSDQPEDGDGGGGRGSLGEREPGEPGGEQSVASPEDDREPERGPDDDSGDGDALGRDDHADL